MRKINKKFGKNALLSIKNNDAITSVISILLVIIMFFSITGGILVWGPQMLDDRKNIAHSKSDQEYYNILSDSINTLIDSGNGSIVNSEIPIKEGSISINSESDKLILYYSYDQNFDFSVDNLGEDQFTLSSSDIDIDIDKARIDWLKNTCFLAGTKVLLSDGSYKNIEEIKIGEKVKSYDFDRNMLVSSTVSDVFYHSPDEIADFYLILNDNLKVTPNHLFYSNGEWTFAGDLDIGDVLKTSKNKEYKISSIERVYNKVSVYDLEISETHNFYVNIDVDSNVLVHNWPYPVEIEEILLDYYSYRNNGCYYKDFNCNYGEVPGPWPATSDENDGFTEFETSGDYESTHEIDDGAWVSTYVNQPCDDFTPKIGVQQNFNFSIDPQIFTDYSDELVCMSLLWYGYVRCQRSSSELWEPDSRLVEVLTDSGYQSIGNPCYKDDSEYIGSKLLTYNVSSEFSDYFDDNNNLFIRGYAGHSFDVLGHGRLSIITDKVAIQFINAKPFCNVSANNTAPIVDENITFHLNAGDPTGSIKEWKLDYGDMQKDFGTGSPPETIEHSYSTTGPKTIELTVWDKQDAEFSNTTAVYVTLGNTPPPTCSLNPSPNNGVSPLDVDFTIDAQSYGNNNYLDSITLDIDNDGNLELSEDIGNKFSYSNEVSDQYTTSQREESFKVCLVVTDENGKKAFDNKTIHVTNYNYPPDTPDKPDIALFSGNAFYNDTTYTFEAKTTDKNENDLLKYKFSWGDGSISDWTASSYIPDELVSVSHSYDNPGVYDIKVKAKDKKGSESLWSDPYSVKVSYKFISNLDSFDSQVIENSGSNPWTIQESDLKNPIEGSVCIQLFSNDYPDVAPPEDKNHVSFGVIWYFDLGSISHKYDSNSESVKETVLQSGFSFTKYDENSVNIDELIGYKEKEGTLGVNLILLRGKNSISASGSGVYSLSFSNNGSFTRESLKDKVFNFKIKVKSEYKEDWYSYLSSNYMFTDKGDYLLYDSNLPDSSVKLMFSTTLVNTDIKDIK